MRLALFTDDITEVYLKLAELHHLGHKAIIKYDFPMKGYYSLYQTNHLGSRKPTKDNELKEWISAYLYKCFGNWKEHSFYDLSKVNQDAWQDYAEKDILPELEKRGYRKASGN